MNKIIILMFCIVLLVGNVSALEFDNNLNYKNNDMDVEFTNAFGLGEYLGSAELKSHSSVTEIKGFGFGKEEVVMYYDFNDWELYENGLGEVEFIDMNTGKQINKDYYFVEWKEIEINVNDYEEVCDILGNGTKVDCNSILVGSHKEKKFDWVRYDSNDIPNGNTTIGLKTYVEKNDYIDGVWTIVGKKVKKHITWTGDLAVGQVSYWKMDEGSGTLSDEQGNNTLATAGLLYSQTGATINTGTSINFSDSTAFKNSPVGMAGDLSGTMWLRADTRSNVARIISVITAGADGINLLFRDPTELELSANDGVAEEAKANYTTYMNSWTFIYWEITSTTLLLYVNNSLFANDTSVDWSGITITNISFGSEFNGNSDYRGGMDEVGIWNRGLSVEEQTYLWDEGVYCAFGDDFCDTGLSITLNSPVDNFNTTNQTIIFNGSVVSTDFRTIQNVSLKLDGVINETNSSGINNTDYLFTKTLAFGEDNNWTYEVCNNASLCNEATIRTFSILNFVENNINFDTEVLETSSQEFELNITTIPSILSVSAFLNYNGTLFQSTTTCLDQNCSIRNTIDIPLVSLGEFENKSFFWEVNVFDGTTSISINSSVNEQNLTRIHLEECDGVYTTQTLNFTVYDEQNLTRISPFKFDSSFDQWLGGGDVKRQTNFSNSSLSEEPLCILPIDETYFIDAIIEYDEVGNATSYTLRNYFFQNDTINNVSQDIFMYLLKASDSTSFILKVQDDSLLPVSNALVEINRYYPGTDEFRIVQIARTDDLGKSVGFFETEIVDYKFFITQNNLTLLETGLQKIIPESSPFTLTFNVGEALGEPWSTQQDLGNLNSSLTWDSTSGIVTYTYIDNSSNFTQARLFVIKQSLVNSSADTTICNETSTLISVTLTCSVGSTDGFYVASSFITRNSAETLDKQFTFQIETLSGIVGLLGLFYGWFLILIASFMFRFNEIAGIWAITITVFLINLMGLINFGGVFVTAVIAIAVILTWIMEK